MYPHRIRLRGPWELLEPEHRRVTVPCRWSDFGIATGPVRVLRRFGYPGFLDSEERVWLTFGAGDEAKAFLNEQLMGDVVPGGAEFEITSLLQQRNRLEMQVAKPIVGLGEVALEVRRTAFLKDVQVARDGQVLRVTGKVVGEADGPLDLYVLMGRSTAGYTTVEAGKTFEVQAEALEGSVRVELVRGAVVWYQVFVSRPESSLGG